MTRYAKIDRRIHGDERVRMLTPVPPCGQGLWFYLLTTPHAGSIPGVIVAGEAMLAEALGWPLKGFREGFAELLREGMAEADWNARLIWLPKAIRHNMPENPNVVRSWHAQWDEVPECPLKLTVWQGLFDALSPRDTWALAFTDTCPKPTGKGMPKGMPKGMANQEQEQEQEQYLSLDAGAPSRKRRRKAEQAPEKRPPEEPLPFTLADLERTFRESMPAEHCLFGKLDPRLAKPATLTVRAFSAAGYGLDDVRVIGRWVAAVWSPGVGITWSQIATVGKLCEWAAKARAWEAAGGRPRSQSTNGGAQTDDADLFPLWRGDER